MSPANLDASSAQPNGGGIELKTLRKPALPSRPVGALEAYNELRRQEKEEKTQEILRRAFPDGSEGEEMKFSHSIQFNAVPDWSSHYIAYSNLKKLYVWDVLRASSFKSLISSLLQDIHAREGSQPAKPNLSERC